MKIIVIGDLHYGMKNDSPKHNQQVSEFLEHIVATHKGDADKVIQLGDWFDNRSKIHLSTLNRGIEGAQILSEAFGKDNVYVCTGNHDMAYRDSYRDSSLTAIEHLVTVAYEPASPAPSCYITPWIVTDEDWDHCVAGADEYKYLFAHLELSSFYMNDHHRMESGQSPKELRGYEMVFTGHYHSYQAQGNILYTGTPIPMSQNEANRDMGYVVLDTETGEWEFVVYDKVRVISIPYDQVEDIIDDIDPENTSIRVEFPDDLEDETMISEVVDALSEMNFSDVKTLYKGNKAQKLLEMEIDDVEEVENIDGVVIGFIRSSSMVEGIDPIMLESLYNEAKDTV